MAAAVERAGSVDAVILPEVAIRPDEPPGLERTLAQHGATFLVAGVRQPAGASAFGRNYLHFGIRTPAGWSRTNRTSTTAGVSTRASCASTT